MALIPILWMVYDNANDPLAGGSANTALQIRRGADGYVLDWDDGAFKAAGWVTPAAELVEDAVVPGLYASYPDAAAWDDGAYQALLRYDDGVATIRVEVVGFQVQDGAEVVQSGDSFARLGIGGAGLTALGDTRLANLDAAVSTRSTATQGATALELTAALSALLLALQGADGDTLKTLSDQIDLQALETTLTAIKGVGWTTETLKALATAIAALNNLSQEQSQAAAAAALTAYDPPTRTEATADKEEIIAEIEAVIISPVQIFNGFNVVASLEQATITIEGSATAKAIFKVGESKSLSLYVKDKNKNTIDLSDAALSLGVKASKTDSAFVIEKDDEDFDKSQASAGIVAVHLDEIDTNLTPRAYVAELRCSWGSGEDTIIKTSDIVLEIQRAVTV